MGIIFTKGATVVNLPNPNYPGELHPSRPQVKNAAIGGRIDVTDLGDGSNLHQPRLTFLRLPNADYTTMKSFLETTVNLTELSFTFTDWDSNTYTVVYWSGLTAFGKAGPKHMTGTIRLQEIPT